MSEDHWLVETYFAWLAHDAFSDESERDEYSGVLRVLHDIPFYWTIWSDENRAGDAMSFRQSDFLSFQHGLDHLDQEWLSNWASASPSVLEVLLAIARRWTFYFEGEVPYYFGHLFLNLRLDRFPGRILPTQMHENIRLMMDNWMSRQFCEDGRGSPFPIKDLIARGVFDMRQLDIWSQMNAYSAEHFQ
jgi:hypothetical protein